LIKLAPELSILTTSYRLCAKAEGKSQKTTARFIALTLCKLDQPDVSMIDTQEIGKYTFHPFLQT